MIVCPLIRSVRSASGTKIYGVVYNGGRSTARRHGTACMIRTRRHANALTAGTGGAAVADEREGLEHGEVDVHSDHPRSRPGLRGIIPTLRPRGNRPSVAVSQVAVMSYAGVDVAARTRPVAHRDRQVVLRTRFKIRPSDDPFDHCCRGDLIPPCRMTAHRATRLSPTTDTEAATLASVGKCNLHGSRRSLPDCWSPTLPRIWPPP